MDPGTSGQDNRQERHTRAHAGNGHCRRLPAVLLLFAGRRRGLTTTVFTATACNWPVWQMQRSRLVCDFRRFAPPEPEQISARGWPAASCRHAAGYALYLAAPGTTAIMFLVDVSDAELPVAPVYRQGPPAGAAQCRSRPPELRPRQLRQRGGDPRAAGARAPSASATCWASSPRG